MHQTELNPSLCAALTICSAFAEARHPSPRSTRTGPCIHQAECPPPQNKSFLGKPTAAPPHTRGASHLHNCTPSVRATPAQASKQHPLGQASVTSSNLVLRLARAQGGREGQAEVEPTLQPEAESKQGGKLTERQQQGHRRGSLLPTIFSPSFP